MKEVVEIEIEMEKDLNKVSVRLLYHLTRSGCSDFSTAQKGRHRFRSIRPTPLPPPPNTLAPPIFNGRQVRHLQESIPLKVAENICRNIEMKNHEKIYEPVYLVRDSKCMRLLWVNFKMGHFRGSSAGIFQLSCYQDRL